MSTQDVSHRPARSPTKDEVEDDHSSCHYEDNDSCSGEFHRRTRRSRRSGHRRKRQQQTKLAALMAESAARRAAEAAALAVKGDVCCDSRSTTTTESESSSCCESSTVNSSSSATANRTPETPPRIVVNRKRNNNNNNNYHPYNNYNNYCPTYSPYHCNAGYFNRMLPPPDRFLALDCEMVGIGQDGTQSALARVSVMDWYGNVVMDEFIKPGRMKVTDYRSFVSGITPEILQQKAFMDYATCRKRVMALLRGKILVGHALENDLGILRIHHPCWMLRDTAQYQPFMKVCAGALWPRRLQDLCQELLGRQVQVYGRPHCPREDAMAALDLYKLVANDWESYNNMMAYSATTTTTAAAATAVPMTAAQYRHQQTVFCNSVVATTTTSVY